MANINKSSQYAVCIHKCDCDVIDRAEKTPIVPGQLVQIFVNKSVNSQCCDIQIYNRENQCFGNELYQCDKKNFSEISPNVWSATNNLRNGSNVTLRLNLPSGNSNVKFCIDSFAECPTLGPGQFCKLNLIDNLIEDVKFEVDIKFYESNQSAHIIRLDKLIEALVLENSTTVNTELVEQSSLVINTCASSGSVQSPHIIANQHPSRIYENAEDVYERNGRIQKNILVGQSAQFDRDTNAHSSNISSNREDENWEKADDLLKNIPETILWKIKNTLPDKESHHTLSAIPLVPIQISDECDTTLTTTSHGIRPVHSTLNCLICGKECDIQLQLGCTHLFCGACLFDVNLKDWKNSYCPFKNKNYSCSYKLTMKDIQNIEDINKNHVIESDKLSDVNLQCVESNKLYLYEGGDHNGEIFVSCKKDNCEGGWFADKSEQIFIYACPKCESYNCLKCEVIHQNTTCEEFNQHNPDYENNNNVNAVKKSTQRLCSTEYYNLLALEENDKFIPNRDRTECRHCNEIIEPEGGVQLRECLHTFCQDCIIRYIEGSTQAPIACPRYDDCQTNLDNREIKSLLSPEMYENYLKISLHAGLGTIENGYKCCIPNCPGYWILTNGINTYNCLVCGNENCVACKASHPNIDCNAYKKQWTWFWRRK